MRDKTINILISCIILMHVSYVNAAEKHICGRCEYYDNYKHLFCDNIFDLINSTGDINRTVKYYDLRDISSAGLAELILLHDAYNYSIGTSIFVHFSYFYEIYGKQPNSFAKSLMIDFLYDAAAEDPVHYLEIAGWELLKGNILHKDTTLGKMYLSMASTTPPELLESRILPFWRDSTARHIYQERHDSLIKEWGHRNDNQQVLSVIEKGDTIAYRGLIDNDQYHKNMIYSIYMIDQYKYIPAYYDLFQCIKNVYQKHNQPLGTYALQWIFKLLVENSTDIPKNMLTELEHEINQSMDCH